MRTHGQRAMYLTGCRCQPCSEAHYRYVKRYKLDYGRGHRRNSPIPPPLLKQLQDMHRDGWTIEALAAATGVPSPSVRNVITGAHPTARHATVQALTTIRWDSYPDTPSGVSPTGTMRRLQALAAIGHSGQDLHQRLGRSIFGIRSGQQETVPGTFARQVAALYNELAMTPGPSTKTRTEAERKKWAPPLAWDDDTIDHPKAKPKFGRRPKGYASNLPDLDLLVAEVNRVGLHIAADKYGVSPASIGIHLNRRGYYASSTGDKYDLPIYRRKAA